MAVYVFQCELQGTPTLFSLCSIFPFNVSPSPSLLPSRFKHVLQIDSVYAPLHGLIAEHMGAITQHFAATCLGTSSLHDVIGRLPQRMACPCLSSLSQLSCPAVSTSPRIQTFCQHISQLGLDGLSMSSLDVAHTYFEAARSVGHELDVWVNVWIFGCLDGRTSPPSSFSLHAHAQRCPIQCCACLLALHPRGTAGQGPIFPPPDPGTVCGRGLAAPGSGLPHQHSRHAPSPKYSPSLACSMLTSACL